MDILDDFKFEGQPIRIVDENGMLLWIASDVCSILELDTSVAVNGRRRVREDKTEYWQGGLDEDEKVTVIVSTPGGPQEQLAVTEPGLFNLILKSKKPSAKRFRRWLTHVVLPELRRTGTYSLPANNECSPLDPLLSLTPEGVFNLPSVAATHRSDLPERPGVYFVVLDVPGCKKILYIGVAGAGTEARSMRERWKNHDRLIEIELLERIGLPVNIHWMAIESNKKLRLGIEEALTDRFRPPLNNSPRLRLAQDKTSSAKPSVLVQPPGSCLTIPLPSQEDFADPAVAELWQEFGKILKRTPYFLQMGFTREQIIEQCWFNPKVSPLGKVIHANLRDFANRVWDAFFES